jgi:hypothetical protein
MRVKNPIVVDAHWHNLDVVFEFPHVLKRLEQDLDRLIRLLRWRNLPAPDPFIVLVDRGDHIVL